MPVHPKGLRLRNNWEGDATQKKNSNKDLLTSAKAKLFLFMNKEKETKKK